MAGHPSALPGEERPLVPVEIILEKGLKYNLSRVLDHQTLVQEPDVQIVDPYFHRNTRIAAQGDLRGSLDVEVRFERDIAEDRLVVDPHRTGIVRHIISYPGMMPGSEELLQALDFRHGVIEQQVFASLEPVGSE